MVRNKRGREHWQTVPRAEKFVILLYGPSGCGKTCIRETLFGSQKEKELLTKKTTSMQSFTKQQTKKTANGEEVEVTFEIIDTVGSGDDSHFQNSVIPVVDELKSRLKNNEKEESVLWLFYFLANHRITDNDVLAIKMFNKYTNVVLLISKADTYTKEELRIMQNLVRAKIQENRIEVFSLPSQGDDPEMFQYPYPILGCDRLYAGLPSKIPEAEGKQADPTREDLTHSLAPGILTQERQVPKGEAERDQLKQEKDSEAESKIEKAVDPRGNIFSDNEVICVNNLIRDALFCNPTAKGRPGATKIEKIRQRFQRLPIYPSDYAEEREIFWWKYGTAILLLLVILTSCFLVPRFVSLAVSLLTSSEVMTMEDDNSPFLRLNKCEEDSKNKDALVTAMRFETQSLQTKNERLEEQVARKDKEISALQNELQSQQHKIRVQEQTINTLQMNTQIQQSEFRGTVLLLTIIITAVVIVAASIFVLSRGRSKPFVSSQKRPVKKKVTDFDDDSF